MKKYILFVLFLVFTIVVSNAQTNITTSTVSGVWNLAGSPYIVHQTVQVPANQTLVVDPGVVVKFKPATRLKVDGQLISSGTANSPITYEAEDTLSFSNSTTTAGAWEGIRFEPYSGPGADSSIFTWCNVKDVKNKDMFESYRGLKIHNCNFTHGISANIVVATALVTDTVDFDNCEISDFNGGTYVLFSGWYGSNSMGGYLNVTNCVVKNNKCGAGIKTILCDVNIENNQLYNNTISGTGVIVIDRGRGKSTVKKNDIHHNTTNQLPSITGKNGKLTIDNNFIHNNISTNMGTCGAGNGGSGIHLGAGVVDPDSTFYLVRNNIIANNYRHAGSAIFIWDAIVRISNNHMINNSHSPSSINRILESGGSKSRVEIKNNIFYSKSPSSVVDSAIVIRILSGTSYRIENNYLPSNFYTSVQVPSNILVGDTNTNIFGKDPQMILPTVDNDYLTDASNANFNLQTTSPCVNNGDTTGCYTLPLDYLGNNRISGTIEIGAFELSEVSSVIDQLDNIENSILLYPNPAINELNISTNNKIEHVKLFNISGRLIRSFGNCKKTIDVSELINGIYFIQISTEEGVFTQKFVKQ